MSESESEFATFRKGELTFHACQLLSQSANPTNKPLYLVCVTTIDPAKRAEWVRQRAAASDHEDDEEDPETDYDEETKLKFFDFQAALRSDLQLDAGMQVKSLSKSLTIKMQ